MTRTGALAALLLAACAPASSPPSPPPQGPPPGRCYALRYAAPDAATVFPARLGFPDGGKVGWGEPAPDGRGYWGMWGAPTREAVPGDSVRVVFSNGFSALVLTFTESADSLSGEAYFASDVVGPTPPPRTPFTGSRAACPSP